MLPYCRHAGTGVIVFSPLARGYLAGGPGTAAGSSAALRAETDKKRQRLYDSGPHAAVVEAVDAVAAADGVLRSQVAIAWILSKTEVTSIIVGPTELDHLTTALDALALKLSRRRGRTARTALCRPRDRSHRNFPGAFLEDRPVETGNDDRNAGATTAARRPRW